MPSQLGIMPGEVGGIPTEIARKLKHPNPIINAILNNLGQVGGPFEIPSNLARNPSPTSGGGSAAGMGPAPNPTTEAQPQPQSVVGQPLRSQQLQQEYNQFVNPPPPSTKNRILSAIGQVAPITLGGLFGGEAGAAGAAGGVEQVNAQQTALHEQRRKELQAGIQSQLGREATMDIEAARERAALERQRAGEEYQTGAATTAFGRAKELAQLPKQDFSLSDTELFMKDPEAYRRMMEIRQETGRVSPPPPSKLLTPEEEAQYIRMHPPRPAAAKTLSPYSESNIVNRLQTRLDSQSKVANELQRQISVMDAGLNAARRGDMAAGSQAVLVTFQKILDPLSVVRESEYARSAAGQSLLNRISGAVGRLQSGGAGIPLSELEKFAQLAREMSQNSTKHLGTVQKQIQDTGKRYGIPPELITFPDVGTGGGAAERIRVRNKATGKTGTISPQYFDPNKYEKQ